MGASGLGAGTGAGAAALGAAGLGAGAGVGAAALGDEIPINSPNFDMVFNL